MYLKILCTLEQVFVKSRTIFEKKKSHHRHLSIPRLSNLFSCAKPMAITA